MTNWEDWKDNFCKHISDWSYFSANEELERMKTALLSQKKAQLLEGVRGRKIALSDKVRAIGSYQLALKEVKKHEWSYNKALADVEALIEKIL